MSDFDKAVDELASNIKTPGEIINKRVLDNLIEANEELYEVISSAEPIECKYYLQTVSNTLRNLRKIRQKLGYEE